MSAFERAQRRWLAQDPPAVVDGRREDLPPFMTDLLDPVVPLPPGVAFDPWLPEVAPRRHLVVNLVTIGWFASVVALVVSVLEGALGMAGLFAVVSAVLAVAAWNAWQQPAAEQEAERALEDGSWRDGRHLMSSACLLVRGERVDLLPRHRVLEVRDRPATGPDVVDGRRVELVVDDAGTTRTVALPPQAAADLPAVEAWLDDGAWVRAYAGAWTWSVVPVGSVGELAHALVNGPWPLDAGFRMGPDWLVHDAPVDGHDVWAVLGTAADGSVRAMVELRIPLHADLDVHAMDALVVEALADRQELDVEDVGGPDLRPRLESPEQHGVTTLALTHRQRV